VRYAINRVKEVKRIYELINKNIVFIIDQLHLLTDSNYKFLIDLLDFNFCIISASANNLQGDHKAIQKLINKRTPKITFSKDEFKLFYQILPQYDNLKNQGLNSGLDFDDDDIDNIMELTGAVPIEMFNFITQLTINGSMNDWVERYINDFNERYNCTNLFGWFSELPDHEKELAIRNISRIINEVSLNDNNDVYDRRLVYQYKDVDGKRFLRAINRVAFNGIVNWSYYSLETKLQDFFIDLMKSDVSHKAKGVMVEHFIIKIIANKLGSGALKLRVHIGTKNGKITFLVIC
jgi:hypothetical protein